MMAMKSAMIGPILMSILLLGLLAAAGFAADLLLLHEAVTATA